MKINLQDETIKFFRNLIKGGVLTFGCMVTGDKTSW